MAIRNYFAPGVNWITYAREIPGQCLVHRMAQADFNIRGWQGRWRYTAPTALFFLAAKPAASAAWNQTQTWFKKYKVLG
jgi:hypothetical protein